MKRSPPIGGRLFDRRVLAVTRLDCSAMVIRQRRGRRPHDRAHRVDAHSRARKRLAGCRCGSAVAVVLAALGLSACGGGTRTVTVRTGSAPVSGAKSSTSAAATGATGGSTPAASGASTASGAVIGSTRSSFGVTLEVNALKRTSQNVVELDFTVIADSNPDSLDALEGLETSSAQLGGAIKLVDEQGQKEYLSVEDSNGDCLCSTNVNTGAAGFAANTRGQFYVDLTAPPVTVTSVDVAFQIAPPVHDVPISP